MPTVTVPTSTGGAVTVTVEERSESRKPKTGDKATNEFLFEVTGTMDDFAVVAAIGAATPAIYEGLYFESVDSVEQVGWQQWYGSAKYVSPNNKPNTNEKLFSFDTTGGTQKVTQSLSTVNKYAVGAGTAPDLKGAINVTEDSVEGVDITVPNFAFSVTFYMPDAGVTDTYVGTLYALTGTVCNAAFYGGDEGEVLFLGASGSKRGRGDWEIAFKFAGSPNVTGLTVGAITGIDKKGWEYLWLRYEKNVSGSGADALVTNTAKYAYVEQVYHEMDLSGLGIGTSS
jgi:hypothetical protein